jgi:hypothetical protein
MRGQSYQVVTELREDAKKDHSKFLLSERSFHSDCKFFLQFTCHLAQFFWSYVYGSYISGTYPTPAFELILSRFGTRRNLKFYLS